MYYIINYPIIRIGQRGVRSGASHLRFVHDIQHITFAQSEERRLTKWVGGAPPWLIQFIAYYVKCNVCGWTHPEQKQHHRPNEGASGGRKEWKVNRVISQTDTFPAEKGWLAICFSFGFWLLWLFVDWLVQSPKNTHNTIQEVMGIPFPHNITFPICRIADLDGVLFVQGRVCDSPLYMCLRDIMKCKWPPWSGTLR